MYIVHIMNLKINISILKTTISIFYRNNVNLKHDISM